MGDRNPQVSHALYIRGFSEGLGRKLRSLDTGFVPKKSETIYTNVCKLNKKFEKWTNVISGIECKTCQLYNIGETGTA